MGLSKKSNSLRSVKNRKKVINTLLKKNKNCDKILMELNFKSLNNSCEAELLNIFCFGINEIDYINSSYTEIIMRQLLFLKDSNNEEIDTISNEESDKINLFDSVNKYSTTIYNYVITYNSGLNVFDISLNDNTGMNIYQGNFKSSKKIIMRKTGNSNCMFLNNIQTGLLTLTKCYFSKLEDGLRKIMEENNFKDLHKLVWNKNFRDSKVILEKFSGTYQGSIEKLYIYCENEIISEKISYNFEKPLFINEDNTIASGRCVKVFLDKIDSEQDMHNKDSFHYEIQSYTMIWDKNNNCFQVSLLNNDKIVFFYYGGDINFSFCNYLKKSFSNSVLCSKNSYISSCILKKVDKVSSLKIPNYSEIYNELDIRDRFIEQIE